MRGKNLKQGMMLALILVVGLLVANTFVACSVKEKKEQEVETAVSETETSIKESETTKPLESNHSEETSSAAESESKETEQVIGSQKKQLQEQYLARLAEVEALNEPIGKGATTTYDMAMGTQERLQNWDDLLNEIYGGIMETLTEEEQAQLVQAELAWIEYRDSQAEEPGKVYEGGSIAPLMRLGSRENTTKGRCYELVELYLSDGE